MLVFWCGAWREVALPEYIDPSWGVAEQQRLAFALLRNPGKAVEEVLAAVEATIFANHAEKA
jgi:hypothetical protein